jgi:predicted Zn-dependent peptidase
LRIAFYHKQNIMIKKQLFRFLVIAIVLCSSLATYAYRYEYQTYNNDPTKAMIYTLPNGLKVYMSINKDKPRLQTLIAVRVGGKNDPAETTGLAHYFEHLMFKGTHQFGTQNYAAEKPMLDQIEQLFETYRVTGDSLQRAQIYHQIDSISYQASLIAIPNEYDKLMATIGSEGSNAYTSQDETCYVEDIPSNQIENWAKIQADRFMHPVLRGFHTELETIYEEKNMSLTQDEEKVIDAMWNSLYPHHPYGTQTVLGSQTHLKNPSITNIKKYHEQWYVPNNMAIMLSGDFDPDNAIDIISKYFGEMKPNANLPKLNFADEAPITQPITREVKGLNTEFCVLAWRLPEGKNPDNTVMNIISEILDNGKCGLIDLNIFQQQRALGCYAFAYNLADKGAFVMGGVPNEGQSLDEVKQLLLEQVQKLRNGEFDESLVQAVITNKLSGEQARLENNVERTTMFTESFINGDDWGNTVAEYQHRNAITKAEVVAIANKYLRDDNFVVINKTQGTDNTELKIAKPQITPIATNRDSQSQFVVDIQNTKVEPIEPHFVNFDTDLTRTTAKDGKIDVLYTQNTSNELFDLTFVYDYGVNAVRALKLASTDYLYLLGTPDMTAEQINTQFYALGCHFGISADERRTSVSLSGLAKNMEPALKLMEHVLSTAVPDQDVWSDYAERSIKDMNDAKLSQNSCFNRLRNYLRYGGADNNPLLQTSYKPDELQKLDPKEITDAIKDFKNYKHRVIYYGPMSQTEFISVLDKAHQTATTFAETPVNKVYELATTPESVIYIAPYDAKQLYMAMYSNRGEKFDAKVEPLRTLYNEYFDGNMNSIVFQEMRESRSLAYGAGAGMRLLSQRFDCPYTYTTNIATQNDKLIDATNAFALIINDMPESQAAFEIAKNSLDARLRTKRTIKDDIAWAWIGCEDRNIDHDIDADLFALLPSLTLQNVIDYQKANVKNRTYSYGILGKIEDLDLDSLKQFGRIVILSLDDIFGY